MRRDREDVNRQRWEEDGVMHRDVMDSVSCRAAQGRAQRLLHPNASLTHSPQQSDISPAQPLRP